MVSGMELLSDKEALIDKVYINGFEVISIESTEKLVELGVKVTKVVHKQKNNASIEHDIITIDKTDLFDVFKCSIIFTNRIFVHLELSIIDDGYQNLNCINADGLRDRLCQIKEFLHTYYGVTVDFKNAKLKKIEINKTILLCHPFEDYQRPLTLMMHLLPDELRLKNDEYNDKDKVKDKDIKYISEKKT